MNNNYFGPPFAKGDNNLNRQMSIPDNNLYDLLQNNIGKVGTFNTIYQNSEKEKNFRGVLENFGNDYILISDPSNGKWYVLMYYSLNYIEFEEKVN